MDLHTIPAGVSGKDSVGPIKKRGRPRIAVTEEVLERRRLSRQRSNARRPKREGPSRKRGRPKRVIDEAMLDSRSLSMPRLESFPTINNVVDVTEPTQTGEGSSRKRGRPKRVIDEVVLNSRSLSMPRLQTCPQINNIVDVTEPTQTANIESELSRTENYAEIIPTTSTAEELAQSSDRSMVSDSATAARGEENIVYGVLGRVNPTEAIPATNSIEREYAEGGKGNKVPGSTSVSGATEGGTSQESRRMRTSINRKKKDFLENNTILNIGRQEERCGFCTAQVWAAEFTGRHVGTGPKGYSICCGKGKVQLPFLRETPPELSVLIKSSVTTSYGFFNKSRIYNNIFAFCSFGGNVDHSVNNGKGPYVFRVCGRTYHSLGSLVPPDGLTPKFAQLYMYDGQEAVDHRVNFPGKAGEVDPTIISMLQEMLERENALVDIFKQARDRFTGVQPEQVHLRLFERRTSDGRFQNLPTVNDYEFAGLVVDNDFANCRDIVAEHKKNGLQHISELHPSFMSLQYPLLFPFGEDGYRTNIKHRNADNSECEKDTVSMREYYAFRAQYRVTEGHTLLLGGRLFLQFIVDAWCSVERGRLLWVQRHQSIIRSDLYNNVVDSLRRGDVDATEVGRRVILPSSFTGGYRYMQQNFQDSLAVCKEYGHPDLFITFTCNPKWDEIEEAVRASGSHDASVRPDIVARVFKMKLDAMLNDFTKKHVLGRVQAVVYTVEFQKRGLPHAHIVLWLAISDKLLTPDDIDNVISAEIPDKAVDPIGYKAVSQFMMHGPCGAVNPKCPCMSNGQCTKFYPKSFNDKTVVDADGYALYRRRDTKVTVECKNIHLDNRVTLACFKKNYGSWRFHSNLSNA